MPWNESHDEQQRAPKPSPRPKLEGWVRIVALALIGFSMIWGWLIVEVTQALHGLPGCTPGYIYSTLFQKMFHGPVPLLAFATGCYAGASPIAKFLRQRGQ